MASKRISRSKACPELQRKAREYWPTTVDHTYKLSHSKKLANYGTLHEQAFRFVRKTRTDILMPLRWALMIPTVLKQYNSSPTENENQPKR